MKLLIVTQKVDRNDPILGFFHRWIIEFAKHADRISVICLEQGEYDLPKNITVYSLGKELRERSDLKNPGPRSVLEEQLQKVRYVFNFYRLIWRERKNYDAVFVHMNQEYVLLGAPLWKLLRKKVTMWRNHAKGNAFTRLAVLLSNKVFYTSPQSFTARFKKSVIMPVGIDTDFFKPNPNVIRELNSILFLGRISPVKKVLEFIDWINSTNYTATIAGPILSEDKAYGEQVLKSLTSKIKYIGPVTSEQARKLYLSHEIYANMTPAGSMDKTILEAAACGARLIVHNPDFKNDFKIEDHNLKALMDKLQKEL